MSKKVIWFDGSNVFVARLGKTTNAKISDGLPVLQTYTFSYEQWELATTSKGFGIKAFFALDHSNCLDCPFSLGNGNGGCYTHKFAIRTNSNNTSAFFHCYEASNLKNSAPSTI